MSIYDNVMEDEKNMDKIVLSASVAAMASAAVSIGINGINLLQF